jgi:hypothetical protein
MPKQTTQRGQAGLAAKTQTRRKENQQFKETLMPLLAMRKPVL